MDTPNLPDFLGSLPHFPGNQAHGGSAQGPDHVPAISGLLFHGCNHIAKLHWFAPLQLASLKNGKFQNVCPFDREIRPHM